MKKISLETLKKFEASKKVAPKQKLEGGIVAKRKAGRPPKPNKVRMTYKLELGLVEKMREISEKKDMDYSSAVGQGIALWVEKNNV